MDFFVVLGAVSGVASIVALFLPATGKRERIIHAIYTLAIAAIACVAIYYQQQYSRSERAKQFAAALLKDDDQYSTEGFNMATLAFLEANKDLFPDSYSRAQQLCKANDCLGAKYGNANQDALDHAYNQINVASALKGLVRGVATRHGT